jgi:hypothetical protein
VPVSETRWLMASPVSRTVSSVCESGECESVRANMSSERTSERVCALALFSWCALPLSATHLYALTLSLPLPRLQLHLE